MSRSVFSVALRRSIHGVRDAKPVFRSNHVAFGLHALLHGVAPHIMRSALADQVAGGTADVRFPGTRPGRDCLELPLHRRPWSATFISFVMLNTGLGEAEFPRRSAHREYVDGLLRIAEQHPGRATFISREVAEYTPVPGDIICADRSHGSRIDIVAARKQELRQGNAPERPMYCDIVVGPGAGSSEVVAVGGNVGQTVAASRFALDPSRRLQRNARHFFVVFQNRIGLLSLTT